jgi:hypothetical protein
MNSGKGRCAARVLESNDANACFNGKHSSYNVELITSVWLAEIRIYLAVCKLFIAAEIGAYRCLHQGAA